MIQSKPEYHYYRAPYAILSFVAGLYCDKYWSDEEFKKWKAGGEVNGEYVYKSYLDDYKTMPPAAALLINKTVPDDERNIADSEGRRAPNVFNCESLWPHLLDELCRPAQERSGGRLPLFYDRKPVLSTLAAIYLGDDISVKQALAYWERNRNADTLAKFVRILEVKGRSDAASTLLSLQAAFFKDLTEPPNCW